MTGSLSLLVLIVSVLFIFPIATVKVGYESEFPLRSHKFSLPIEMKKFWLPVVVILTLTILVLNFMGATLTLDLIDHALFPQQYDVSEKISLRDFLHLDYLAFSLTYFGSCYLWGRKQARIDKEDIRIFKAENKRALIFHQNSKFIGFWGTFFHTGEAVDIHIDVLTSGERLYTGLLYYYEANNESLSGLALTHTKRFLDKLEGIKGNDEEKYSIPGRVTYFNGAQINNINIRFVEQQIGGSGESQPPVLVVGQNLNLEDPELKKILEIEIDKIIKDFPAPPPP